MKIKLEIIFIFMSIYCEYFVIFIDHCLMYKTNVFIYLYFRLIRVYIHELHKRRLIQKYCNNFIC